MTLCATRNLARDTRLVFKLLEKLQGGLLEIRLPGGDSHLFGQGDHGVTLQVHDEAMFGQVLAKGDIGLTEAYLDGHWDSPDITGLMTLLAANREQLKRAVYGSWRSLIAARVRHWLNANSRSGSKRNIMAHYDLGNDFYKLWLVGRLSRRRRRLARSGAARQIPPYPELPERGTRPERAGNRLRLGRLCRDGGAGWLAHYRPDPVASPT
jgi:hypothetical protein